MAISEDDASQKKPARHAVGEDLSTLSVDELEERIGVLRDEIERIEAAIDAKRASADVAASFFKT